MFTIHQLHNLDDSLDDLSVLLVNCVDAGASIGFLPPMDITEARAYWQSIGDAITRDAVILLIAEIDSRVVATVQLAPYNKPNGMHLADVRKLMVHTDARQQGIAKALMLELERLAHSIERTLLVLDTRQGDVSELLYQGLGYQKVGVIPGYALNGDGIYDPTVYYYKDLNSSD